MMRQALRRNASAVAQGRVHLTCASSARLPVFDEPFDKIFTINSIHFWHRPEDCLRSLYELLKPGGLIAITVQPRSRSATQETAKAIGDELFVALSRVGFVGCRLEVRPAERTSIVCALGRKPL
jgi:SAM-dependent methyltransferase